MMSNASSGIVHLVSDSAYLALVEQRESLMRALDDLDEIRNETQSATLRLAMHGPLLRIGDAIEAMTEVTRKD